MSIPWDSGAATNIGTAKVLLGQGRMVGHGTTSRTLQRAAARADRPKRSRPKPTARGFAGGR